MKTYDLLIIGGGPAGLTAGMYGARSGLSTMIIDEGDCGGQGNEAPMIENYPGFQSISGMELMGKFREHVGRYVEIRNFERVEGISSLQPLEIKTDKSTYKTRSLILTTGARHRKLGVPGEREFKGRGVSYCAVCDGYFFRGKHVCVIGGGNTALSDAIYLKGIFAEVKLIHRRNELRGESALQHHAKELGVDFILNAIPKKIFGDKTVEGIKLERSGEEVDVGCDGVFISIGYEPNNELARSLDLDLDEHGWIKVDKEQRTSMKNIYAAGDVTGGVDQIVVACAEGAIAALTAYKELKEPYWA